ncbi:lipoyl(octanoyl) transferase LipB [Paludibacter sp. 221]|uniref:lipoyl(octanoyl) transferase LipB n=1 Tax=Paludibacter sp. 221 TaxID=2302939 RepID=UPI0013D4C2CC|nr:lipoyl(octanoyl) transferase LipB [Paludibacter sp. 221]NDV46065.1 lipoyl(octanoyl) transferase LipB [Paludibacter sp. 221]
MKYTDWGLIDYNEAWEKQELIFNDTINRKKNNLPTENNLIFCEHPHVYTLGKSGKEQNMLLNMIQLQAKNATFVHTNRGGDITYHGPGQLVGYPIFDLDRLGVGLKQYIHKIEEAIINMLKMYGVESGRLDGATGVWLDADNKKARKICAIGVRSSHFVTMHGFALNVNTQLEYFNYINPCGFVDKGVTSMQKELGKEVDMEEVKINLRSEIEKQFAVVIL